MVDDKDESAPDPWAGIDDDAAGQSADGFSFSFDAASEISDQSQPPAADEGEGAAGVDDISAWLSEPSADVASEEPLAIFPPEGVIETDDLHHEAHGIAEPPMGSSHVEVGTGFSGLVSPSGLDPASGDMPVDEWPEALAADAASETGEPALDDFTSDDQPSFDASGFDGVSDLGEAAAPGAEEFQQEGVGIADAAAAATVAAAKPRARARKQGGGIGQLIAIVLGGVMAIPITYAILIWGFERDPFKLAGMMPEQVAFLLPQKLQPGFRNSGGPKLDAPSALDDLPAVPDTPEPPAEPATVDDPAAPAADLAAAAIEGEPVVADAPMKMPADASFDEPATPPLPPAEPPGPPEPEPLDLTALNAAVGEASAAFDELAAADPEAPERKKLLVAWYKRLAAAAEQLVLLEKVAVDSGRPLGDALAAIDPLSTGIAADGGLQKDLARLGGMWLGSKKRAVDGAVLLATFDGVRRVGPYWSILVTVDGAEPLSVNVISRTEPKIEPGERVLVTGVVFDGDVIWAADCRSLAKTSTPVEDLF